MFKFNKKTKPYHIYVMDIILRSTYILVSFLFSWGIFFHFIETIFLFEVLPIVTFLLQKRFIVTQLTQLFNTIWFICTILGFTFTFPLFVYHIGLFFGSGWYIYQIRLYKLVLNSFYQIFLITYLFNHLFLIPCIIKFFLYWEILDEYSLLRIEAEISISFYIEWIFIFKFLISFLLSTTILFIITLLYFLRIKYLYSIVLSQKNFFVFIGLFILMFLTPPDFLVQLLLIVISFGFFELFLFFTCIKLLFSVK